MISRIDRIDEIDLECKINEYKNLKQLQKTYEIELLRQPIKLFNKVENNNVLAVLTLNRIDECLNKTIQMKLNLRK